MAARDEPVDAKALMSAIAKGWKLVDTPKVRAGFKRGQQKLVQANGKTLGLITLREQGVRVEGSRLAKNVTVPKDATVEQARKLLADVEQENVRKTKEREAKATKRPAPRVDTAVPTARVEKAKTPTPSGSRARNRSAAVRGETVA